MERTYGRVSCHHGTSRRRRGDTDRIRNTLFVSVHDRRRSRMASRVLKRWSVMVLSIVAVPFAFVQAQAPSATAAQARVSKDFLVGHEQVWMSTELDIRPGERVALSARGSARCPGVPGSFGPEGTPREFWDLLRTLPAPEAGRGALIGRIGAPPVALPFIVGSRMNTVSPSGGVLALGVNRAESDACTVAFDVHLDVFPAEDTTAVRVPSRVETLDGVNEGLFSSVPRQLEDEQGNPGDMVNLLILGSEEHMRQVFASAGWITVDRDVIGALISGAIATLSKEAYLRLPMSPLYLFGRPQDYGWAHAEPITVVASRHHLRLWRAPVQISSSNVWVGAATHDIGFERDRRNNGITHRIDPNVDAEREFVEQTLTGTGIVRAFTYFLPAQAIREGTTATGGYFYSDGRVLALKLDEAQSNN
jgi:LssY C-terminus